MKLYPRLLGVLAIFAMLVVAFWAIVRFGVSQQSGLSLGVVERLDGDPLRIQSYLDEMSATLTQAGAIGLAIGAVLACAWLFLIHRNPPFGDQSARAKRTSWAVLFLIAIVATIAVLWSQVIAAPIAELIAPSVPITVTGIALGLLVLGYWLSTAIFAPASTKVAVPGATMFGG